MKHLTSDLESKKNLTDYNNDLNLTRKYVIWLI